MSVNGQSRLLPRRFRLVLASFLQRPGLPFADALTEEVERGAARVAVGEEAGLLPAAGMRWARRPNPEAWYPDALISRVSTALAPGDVILVRRVEDLNIGVMLEVIQQTIAQMGNINPWVTLVALITLASGILAKRYVPRLPYMIVAMVVGSVAALLINLSH